MAVSAFRRKLALASLVVAVSAGGAATWFTGLAPIAQHGASNLLAALHGRSPGARPDGAKSNKHRASAVLADATPVKPRSSKVLPAALAAPQAAAPLIAGAATPIPAAIAPLAAPALVPAAASAGSGLFFPPLFFPGGGGGGGITTTVVPPPGSPPPPPGGGGGPPPVPGVPEPQTWAMMAIGFALVGGILRRRRRDGAARQTNGREPRLAEAASSNAGL
jgi:PEP-CTERM motif-containing protein